MALLARPIPNPYPTYIDVENVLRELRRVAESPVLKRFHNLDEPVSEYTRTPLLAEDDCVRAELRRLLAWWLVTRAVLYFSAGGRRTRSPSDDENHPQPVD